MPYIPVTFNNRRVGITVLFICTTLLFSAFSGPLNAAYCSLRDPLAAINVLYPESDSHRSIVRPISQEARQLISNELPFTLHFNEIGQHTVYVAQKEKQPVGFIHARSELSNNGMIEIAWAINLDMSLNGFFFQRCRSPECVGALPQQLSQNLTGKTYSDLLLMLNETSSNLTPGMQLQYGAKSDLVLSVIRSALKTISITRIAWHADIDKIRQQVLIAKHFGPLSTVKLQSQATLPKPENYSIIQSDTVKTYAVLNNEQIIGYLAAASWKQDKQEGKTHWLFSTKGKVLDVEATKKWPNAEIQTAFQEVIGIDFSLKNDCSTAVESAGKFLYTALFTAL